ncbi:MAG: hypothetical protein V1835_07290 [Candidatus Micrarchaeota archaeon]
MGKKRKMYNYANLEKEVKENRREMQELRERMDSLIETFEILSDKRAMESIRASEADFRAGRVKPLGSLLREYKIKK